MSDIDLLSLTSANGFKISGAAVNDLAGISVSSAGDINGDGIADIVIGAFKASPNSRSEAGAAYVIYGKQGGLANLDLLSLTSANGFKISGAVATDYTGWSVSSAGDINGDGIADLVIGAYGAAPNSRWQAGAAYVIYGKQGGLANLDLLSLTSANGFKISGAVAGERAGTSVSSAGDINGDGIADLVIGADAASPNGREVAGAAYVIYGKQGGLANLDLLSLTSANGFKISGAVAGDRTSGAVSSAGDVNYDGIADLIIGAVYADPSGRASAGAAYVIYGKQGGLANLDLLSLTSANGFKISGAGAYVYTGDSVSSAGDINGDGITDLIIGAYGVDDHAGAAYVIYGKQGGLANLDLLSLTSASGFKISGAVVGDQAGTSVSSAGDVNYDGIADLIIGAVYADPSGRASAGVAYVIYGKQGGLANLDLLNLTSANGFKISGAVAGDRTGGAVSSAGDINGDGIADLVIGAVEADPSGRTSAGAAYVIYGAYPSSTSSSTSSASPSLSPSASTPGNNDNSWFSEHSWELLGPIVGFAGTALVAGLGYYCYKHHLHHDSSSVDDSSLLAV